MDSLVCVDLVENRRQIFSRYPVLIVVIDPLLSSINHEIVSRFPLSVQTHDSVGIHCSNPLMMMDFPGECQAMHAWPNVIKTGFAY